MKELESKFIKVRCIKCKNEQVVFEKPSSEVKCLVCGALISTPKGGKGKIKASLLEVLE